MTMDITVALPSGQNASLSVAADATVGWLKCAAQQRLKTQGLLQLLTKEGQMLLAAQRCLWEEGLKDGDAKFIYEQFCLLLLKCGMICFRDKASCAVSVYCIIICVWVTNAFWTLIFRWRIISTANKNSMGFPSTSFNHQIPTSIQEKTSELKPWQFSLPRIASLPWWRCRTWPPPSQPL